MKLQTKKFIQLRDKGEDLFSIKADLKLPWRILAKLERQFKARIQRQHVNVLKRQAIPLFRKICLHLTLLEKYTKSFFRTRSHQESRGMSRSELNDYPQFQEKLRKIEELRESLMLDFWKQNRLFENHGHFLWGDIPTLTYEDMPIRVRHKAACVSADYTIARLKVDLLLSRAADKPNMHDIISGKEIQWREFHDR